MQQPPREPLRASAYSKEMALRLKTSAFEQRYVVGAVVLGQFLSLCLCGTGVTSELLVTDYDISVPTTQCFINYLLLALTFGVYFATKKRFLTVLKYNWWKYIVLGVIDVEANFLFVLAYRYTNLTSIQLLDCFTIVVVMILSYVFLRTRYKLINIMGVLLTCIGIACLVFADLDSPRNSRGSAKWLGDMLCLVGAILYAAGNVCQEYLVKSHSILEYLGLIGVVGSFVSGAQLIGLEWLQVAKIQWSPAVGGLFSGFGILLFLFYSLAPCVIRMSSAVVFNLSLLTADFYTLLFGIFLFNYNFNGFYILGFSLVVLGIFIYNLKHPQEKKLRERTVEERKESSIERQYSVVTTRVDSSTEHGTKIQGLLESSFADSSSMDTLAILSRSYQIKPPRYGTTPTTTPTEMKIPVTDTFSPYETYHHDDGDTPLRNGVRRYRDSDDSSDDEIVGCQGRRRHRHGDNMKVEIEVENAYFPRSAPSLHHRDDEGGGEGGRRRRSDVWVREKRYQRRSAMAARRHKAKSASSFSPSSSSPHNRKEITRDRVPVTEEEEERGRETRTMSVSEELLKKMGEKEGEGGLVSLGNRTQPPSVVDDGGRERDSNSR